MISCFTCFRAQGFPEDSGLFAWVRLRWVEGDPSSLAALRSAELGSADSIVIGDSGEGPAKEADALTLTTIALAQVPLFSPLEFLTVRDVWFRDSPRSYTLK